MVEQPSLNVPPTEDKKGRQVGQALRTDFAFFILTARGLYGAQAYQAGFTTFGQGG